MRRFVGAMRVLEHEREEARRSGVSARWVEVVAFLGVASFVLAVLPRFMYFAKYSQMAGADFASYHLGATWFGLLGGVLLLVASWLKGVRYWVVYAVTGVGVVAGIVLLGLMYGVLEPSSLEWANRGPAWWRGG